MKTYWHPFADMSVVATSEIVIERGDGAWVWDTNGKRYLDASASLWYCNVGYGRDEIADAVARQLRKLPAYSNFGVYTTGPTLELAERLAALSPIPNAAVFLTSGGSEAVDSAAKIARRYWDVVGKPERRILIGREFAYHGMNAYGTELAGMAANRAGYGGTIVEAVEHIAYDDPGALERLLDDHGEQVAAFIGEPVVGAGGVLPPAEGYWADIERICRANDILLIADEVITGFGRLGRMFGSERYQMQPDLITFAKGVTSGYFPLGGVLIGERVRAPFWDGPAGTMLRHGYTYSGHATGCAAALANIDIIEREALVDRVRRLEPVLAEQLGRLASDPSVGEVRVAGLLGAVELTDEMATNTGFVDRLVVAAREHGVLTRNLRGRALQISPPFVIDESEIRQMVDGIQAALSEVVAAAPAGAATGR